MDGGNIGSALVLLIILIAVNATLASAELALLGLHEEKLRLKAEAGDKQSRLLLHMKQHPSNFLSTIQIGITLAGLLSGAFAADNLARPIASLAANHGVEGVALSAIQYGATLLITLLMTFFMLVFGELVPKRIAMANPEKTARSSIGFIHMLSKIARPLVFLLTASTNGLLRLLRVNTAQEETVTEEDVLMMMRTGQQQGKIEAVEVQMVTNLFEFTDLTVADAMTHRTELKVLQADGTLEDVVAGISETGLNKFPVVDGSVDHIIGVLYSKDIVSLYPHQSAGTPAPTVRDCMRMPYFVPENKMLVQLFTEMKEGGERMAVVVDDYGGTSGIITLMDILEEIVGDLNNPIAKGITEPTPGCYLIDGRMELKKVAGFLNLSEGNGEGGTFSGYLIEKLGYVPQPGQHPELTLPGYLCRVEEAEGGLIRSVYVMKKT